MRRNNERSRGRRLSLLLFSLLPFCLALWSISTIANVTRFTVKSIGDDIYPITLMDAQSQHSLEEWTINWDLILSQSWPNKTTVIPTNAMDKTISDRKIDLSHIVSWHKPNYIGRCGPQRYHPLLGNATGFPYLSIHDVMSVDNGSKVWIFGVNPGGYFDESERDDRKWIHYYLWQSTLLCAFSDGSTFASYQILPHRRGKNFDYIIIECPIPPHLRSHVLRSTHITTIGVTIFDPRHRFRPIKRGDIWNNISLPVCSTYIVNQGRHSMIYRNDGPKYNRLFELQTQKGIKVMHSAEKKNFVGFCTLMHATHSDKFGQSRLRLYEWIEFHLMLAVDHFYIFEHLPLIDDGEIEYRFRNRNRIELSDTHLAYQWVHPYVSRNLITYVPWYHRFSVPWVFQYSFLSSCLRRFAYDNRFIGVIDIDEFIIPPQPNINSITTLSAFMRGIMDTNDTPLLNMFVLLCKLATTCRFETGCDQRFDLFINRHKCIADESMNTNLKKFMINPLAVHYAFVHNIKLWVEGSQRQSVVFEEENGQCIHMRDHFIPGHTHTFDTPSTLITDLVQRFQTLYAGNLISTVGETDSIHPLFDNDYSQYCPL